VPAFVDPAKVDELVIRSLCPASRGFIVLAGKDAHGGRDGHVGGGVKIDVLFPIIASR
jgi:hypothetical protein